MVDGHNMMRFRESDILKLPNGRRVRAGECRRKEQFVEYVELLEEEHLRGRAGVTPENE